MVVWEGPSSIRVQTWLFREQRVFEGQVVTSGRQTQSNVSAQNHEATLFLQGRRDLHEL